MEKVGNILNYFKKSLTNRFDEQEVSSWAYLSINHLLGFSKSDCIIRAHEQLTEAIQNQLLQITEKLFLILNFQIRYIKLLQDYLLN